MDAKLLTSSEVAALFRVDPQTVIRWGNVGLLSFIRTPGGHRRYSEDEVRTLLEPDSAEQQGQAMAPAAYFVGDPDPTDNVLGLPCGAPIGMRHHCTWEDGHVHPQHVAGNGVNVVAVCAVEPWQRP